MLSKPIGKILHYNQKEFGIEGATENAQFRITVYNPFIIRVHFTRTSSRVPAEISKKPLPK